MCGLAGWSSRTTTPTVNANDNLPQHRTKKILTVKCTTTL